MPHIHYPDERGFARAEVQRFPDGSHQRPEPEYPGLCSSWFRKNHRHGGEDKRDADPAPGGVYFPVPCDHFHQGRGSEHEGQAAGSSGESFTARRKSGFKGAERDRDRNHQHHSLLLHPTSEGIQ